MTMLVWLWKDDGRDGWLNGNTNGNSHDNKGRTRLVVSLVEQRCSSLEVHMFPSSLFTPTHDLSFSLVIWFIFYYLDLYLDIILSYLYIIILLFYIYINWILILLFNLLGFKCSKIWDPSIIGICILFYLFPYCGEINGSFHQNK